MKRNISKSAPNSKLKFKQRGSQRGNLPKRLKPRRKANPEDQAAAVTASALNKQHMEDKLQKMMVGNETSFVSVLNSSIELTTNAESQDPFGSIASQDMLADPYAMGDIFESQQEEDPRGESSKTPNFKLVDIESVKPVTPPVDETPNVVPYLVEPLTTNLDLARRRSQNDAPGLRVPSVEPANTNPDLDRPQAENESNPESNNVIQPPNEEEEDSDSEVDTEVNGGRNSGEVACSGCQKLEYERRQLKKTIAKLTNEKLTSDNLALRLANELQSMKDKQKIPMAKFTNDTGIEITVAQLEALSARANTDSVFVGLLCITLVGVDKLKSMSVTGQPSHRFINAKGADGSPLYGPTEKMDPEMFEFICDKVAERTAIRVGPENAAIIRAASAAKVVRKYIGLKISNLKKHVKPSVPSSSKSV